MDMHDWKLVGLTGKKYAGKSTFANHMEELAFFTPLSFASPIKKGAKAMFNYTNQQMNDPTLKEKVDPELGFSPRQAMQALGTEGVRNALGLDVWVRLAQREATKFLDMNYPRNRVVFDDVRFDNEAQWIRKLGGLIIHIINPDEPKSYAADPHQSENGINHHMDDMVVTNSKSAGPAAFQLQVHKIAMSLNWL